MTALPLVGVSACRQEVDGHVNQRCSEKYVTAVAADAGAVPVMIPALASALDVASLVANLDGLLLTGSPSNVEPHLYDGPASVAGTAHDPARDGTTLPLIRAAVAAAVPVFAICRGLQELNVAFGGSLHQRVFDLPGHFDHRMRRDVEGAARYRVAHSIAVTEGGLLASIWGDNSARLVNSLHAQAIDQLADKVMVEAVSPDGIIEAISVRDAPAFALGVQWHPEWPRPLEAHNQKLFTAFGAACKARATERMERRQAAE